MVQKLKHNIAIVIPVYNTQDYLHRCISSILNQREADFQCILIDDGSTDNSSEICRYYQKADSRITFVAKKNGGQGSARNVGIDISDAEYLYFVDSDDSLGSDTLRILYRTAKEFNLDLCSPSIPEHYFSRPLEAVACLPTKAQFIRADIVRKFNIRQPDARSGQDGVFSHMFLAHALRIGMARSARYIYTPSRDGSTFQTYLKKPEAVAGLIDVHYAAITAHYDEWNLWQRNASRLMEFISEESLKNRIIPHYKRMTEADLAAAISRLTAVAIQAGSYLHKDQLRSLSPLQSLILEGDLSKVVEALGDEKISKMPRTFLPKNNIIGKETVVCEFNDISLGSQVTEEGAAGMAVLPGAILADTSKIESTIAILSSKLDFAINTVLNSAAQSRAMEIQQANQTRGYQDIEAIVSLTTLPSRLPVLPFVLDSIVGQNCAPEKIIVWLGKGEQVERNAMRALRGYFDHGVELRFVEDVGPHTKLIYALQEFPDKTVITMDDDMLYPYNALQYLWDQHLRHPGTIVANWARELAFDNAGKVLGIRAGKLLTPPLMERKIEQPEAFSATPSLRVFAYGTCGVLYPVGALHDTVFDVPLFKKLCPREDDLWFKAMAMLNGTPGVWTNLGINPPHHSVLGSQIEALRYFNHGESQNQVQFRAVFDHFDLYKYLEKN